MVDDDSTRISPEQRATLNKALQTPFLRGLSGVMRQKQADAGPPVLGDLVEFDAAVQFFAKSRQRYDIVSANQNGALVVGLLEGIEPGDALRLGPRSDAGVVFVLAVVLSVDSGSARLGRMRIGWEAFTGTSESLVASFFAEEMGVTVGARFHRGGYTQ
jgi:hypothetical protein